MDYPVSFDVPRPARFQRRHVAIRLLLLILLSLFGASLGWIFFVVYLALPTLAGLWISQSDGERFLAARSVRLVSGLRWLLAFYSYLALLTDTPPLERPEDTVHFEVHPAGRPTVGSALLRLFVSLPALLFLLLLCIVSSLLWLVSTVLVLIEEDYPVGIHSFQCGVLRFEARLLAFHASLVDRYPPFTLAAHEPTPAPGGPRPTGEVRP